MSLVYKAASAASAVEGELHLIPRSVMSKHSSLKASGSVGGQRSVLKRFERVKVLKERGQWKQGQSPIGLPKTKFES